MAGTARLVQEKKRCASQRPGPRGAAGTPPRRPTGARKDAALLGHSAGISTQATVAVWVAAELVAAVTALLGGWWWGARCRIAARTPARFSGPVHGNTKQRRRAPLRSECSQGAVLGCSPAAQGPGQAVRRPYASVSHLKNDRSTAPTSLGSFLRA